MRTMGPWNQNPTMKLPTAAIMQILYCSYFAVVILYSKGMKRTVNGDKNDQQENAQRKFA